MPVASLLAFIQKLVELSVIKIPFACAKQSNFTAWKNYLFLLSLLKSFTDLEWMGIGVMGDKKHDP